METAVVTNVQGFSIHDGPGIRTVVFIKGCPLRCQWCANPENISPKPDIGFLANLCKGCGKCAEVCGCGAVNSGVVYRIDREKCVKCFKCVEACNYGALTRYGETMTSGEIYEKVRRDKMFYDSSGGGVTFSGGEPLTKAKFVAEVFALLRAEGIDTCIETCGAAPWESFEIVLPATKRFLFDLKLFGSEKHRLYTGMNNTLIFFNAKSLTERGADILFRRPLIPGVNDSEAETQATAELLRTIGAPRLELMPYHRLGQSKYAALNMACAMGDLPPLGPAAAEKVRAEYEKLGVSCTISR